MIYFTAKARKYNTARVWLKLSVSRQMRHCLNLKQVVCLNFVLYTVPFHDFHFKRILKERGRSCYFSSRELFCVFILTAINTLKFEEIGVHLWIVKIKFISSYRPLKYSTFQLFSSSPIDGKQQRKTYRQKHNVFHPSSFILRRQHPLYYLVSVALIVIAVMLVVRQRDYQFTAAYIKFNLCGKKTEHLNN